MYSARPPSQFERPPHHPRHHHPPPSREQRPLQNPQADHGKSSRGPVPFNRVQLAAALIEYNDNSNHDQASGINWEIQEISHQPIPPIKQAPYSAIFIPFRQTLPSKPLDFFSGLELTSSPKSHPKSLSGFGLVSESGIPKIPETITVDQRRFSENVVIGNIDQNEARTQVVENELEVLSEWGLDKVLSGNLTESGSASDPHHQEITRPQTTQPNQSRPLKNLSERQEVKSDMFDFHFSELRLDQENQIGKTTTTRDFLRDKVKIDDLNPVIDDEALLRQRVGCDPGGRKFLRPQSVMELKETQLLYQNPRSRLASTSKTKQLALARSRVTTLNSQRAVWEEGMKGSSKRNKSKSRARSLSPAGLASSIIPSLNNSHRTRQRSASGILQSSRDLSTDPIPARTRRKSALDEPSTHRLNLKPLEVNQRLSSPISPKSPTRNISPGPRPKGRTSADIAERYQKSIALLDGRKSEDMTYDVPNQLGSSLGGSQQGQDGELNNRENDSTMLTRAASTSHSQSEFSIGVPRQFTSRFDPKVASVLSQATPTGISQPDELDDEQMNDRSFDDDEGVINAGNLEDDNLKPIYDEHGRIRFPTSLKPMVLIMPIPLTPAQPEPDQAAQENDSVIGSDDLDPLEKAKLEQMEKLKQIRPAGKLYGRSLIDELNSRTAAQKSRQIAFGANNRAKMFLSPEDASRPGSIYSSVDPVPGMQLKAPNNVNSRLHLANEAVRTTQYKFNQALVNSSKARQSVFGMDMVMKAELEKLKKIKAIEEKELQEEEMKIEAKEAKKQAKKKGKKKIDPPQEPSKLEVKDKINDRLSRLDNWDAILEREAKPAADLESRYSAALNVRETKYFTPLPVLPTPIDSNQNLVSNMDDWFKDKLNESSDNHTPMVNSPMDDDNEFGNENTLARKLELQVENMKYKPLPNVFETHHMVRPDSVQSHAAFLSVGPSSNTPNILMTSPRTLVIEEHPEQEELLNVISGKNHGFLDQSSSQTHEEDDDNVPLSMRRNSNFPKFNLAVEEDDNRPLSMIGTKLAPAPIRSPCLSTPSTHDSDEELPLGIRASILISQKHPPVDLTNDAESSDGPIGSNASDESDLVPLALRATILRPLPSQAFHPSSLQSYSNIQHPDTMGGQSVATNPGLVVSQGYSLRGSHRVDSPSSAHSIGGESDDIPLGTKIYQPPQVSNFNPAFSYPNLSPMFNNPLQAHFNSFSNNAQAPIITSNADDNDDDDDDDVPIGRRITLAPPSPPLKVGPKDKRMGEDKELDKIEVLLDTTSSGSIEDEKLKVDNHQRREIVTLRSPIISQIIVDESVAREDTLATLEGRGILEGHTDDDVPLGVTRAAHSVAANGTLQRERTRRRKMERERKQEANKAKANAELELLTQKEGSVQQQDHTTPNDNHQSDNDEDEDEDVPLGMSHHVSSILNLTTPNMNQNDSDDDLPLGIQQQSMHLNLLGTTKMIQQQNHGIGFHSINLQQQQQQQQQHLNSFVNPNLAFHLNHNFQSNISLLPFSSSDHHLNHHLSSNPNFNLPIPPSSNSLTQSDSNISKWRNDILK